MRICGALRWVRQDTAARCARMRARAAPRARARAEQGRGGGGEQACCAPRYLRIILLAARRLELRQQLGDLVALNPRRRLHLHADDLPDDISHRLLERVGELV